MTGRGDIEAVNLRTGERFHRVTGNGKSHLESLGIPGLKPVNPADLADYDRGMEEVVPHMIRDVKRRQQLAQEARTRVL